MKGKSRNKMASAPYKFRVKQAVRLTANPQFGGLVSSRRNRGGTNYYMVGGCERTEGELEDANARR